MKHSSRTELGGTALLETSELTIEEIVKQMTDSVDVY